MSVSAKHSKVSFYDFNEKDIHRIIGLINEELTSGNTDIAILVKVPEQALSYIDQYLNQDFEILQEQQPTSRTTRASNVFTLEISNPKKSYMKATRSMSFDSWLQKGGYIKKDKKTKTKTKKSA